MIVKINLSGFSALRMAHFRPATRYTERSPIKAPTCFTIGFLQICALHRISSEPMP
jgi:hypothetical protein